MNLIFEKLLENKSAKFILFIALAILSIFLLFLSVENIFSDVEGLPKLKGIFAVIYLIFNFIGNFVGGIYNAALLLAFLFWISVVKSLKEWLFNSGKNESDPIALFGLVITLFLFSIWGNNFLSNQKKVISHLEGTTILTSEYKNNEKYSSIYDLKYSNLNNVTTDEAIVLSNYEKSGYLPSKQILQKMGDISHQLMLKIAEKKGFIKK